MVSLAHTPSTRQSNLYRAIKLAAVLYMGLALGGIARGGPCPLDRIPSPDRVILARVAAEYGLSGEARQLLLAIRLAENGGPGREMGVLVPAAMRYAGDHARSLECQARWAAGTIQRRYRGDLAAFAARWAPQGVANDPQGLNRHWELNIRRLIAAMADLP